jgi:aminoglycoside phosphotransferase (APT) family kinase protein
MAAMAELDLQELLDRATLAADARWPGAAITRLEPLQGGVSSITFAATLTDAGAQDRRVVVKVAPPGLAPVRNRDVLRQARLLHALAGAPGVRVPEILLEDDGRPPFFVMSFVEGESYEPKLGVGKSPPGPEIIDRRARAAAQMLARLQSLEPADYDLAEEPVIGPAEELERWRRLFETCPDDLRPGEQELYEALAASVPETLDARILHGDYRMGNMQFAGDHLAAIIDWEIWSLGDPRHDLAWLLVYADPAQRFVEEFDAANAAAAAGMPKGDELLAEYLAVRPVELGDLDWFLACCNYKIASTTAVLSKRNRRLPEPDPTIVVAASTLPAITERGREILARART